MSTWMIRDPDGRILHVTRGCYHDVEVWLQRHTPFSHREAFEQGFTVQEFTP